MLKRKIELVRCKLCALSLIAMTSVGITSCIDSRYDLGKEIDMTINIGGEHFAIPVGSTEQVMLGKIIKPEDSDMLVTIGNEYHMVQSGEMKGASVEVLPVKIDEISSSVSIKLVEENLPNAKSQDLSCEINETLDGFDMIANGIGEEVKVIQRLDIVPTILQIELSLDGTLPCDGLLLQEVRIALPDYLVFESDNSLEGNTLIIRENQPISITGSWVKQLKVKGYDFSKSSAGELIVKEGSVHVQGKAAISGTVSVVKPEGVGLLNLAAQLTLNPMEVRRVTGRIQPSFEMEPTRVALNDIPDFLSDENVILDVENPIFIFTANNPLSADLILSGTLAAKKEGNILETVALNSPDNPISIPKNSEKSVIAIVQKECSIDGVDEVYVIPNLKSLVRTIPDEITVDMKAEVTSSAFYSINLGTTYEIKNPSYNMDVPLSFGQDLYLVYNDSITGLGKEIDKIEFAEATILLDAYNTVPLKLEILQKNIIPGDVEGNPIEGIAVAVEGVIAESSDGEQISESQLSIKMTETVPGAIKKLDRLDFKVTAVPGSATGTPLKDNQWFQFKNMKMSIPGGIKIDMN